MQLDSMAIFAAVAECGSFSKAARMLNLPLSTVSRRVVDLEKDLSTQLILRTTRSLKLTEAGILYFSFCRDLIERADQARNAIQTLQKEPVGNIRLLVPFPIDSHSASFMISSFMNEFKGITIDVIVSDNDVSNNIDRADIVVSFGPKPETNHCSKLLGHTEIGFHASKKYVALEGCPQSLSDLETHSLIGCSTIPKSIYSNIEVSKLVLNYRINTNDLLVARHACIDGLGIAWLPKMVCARAVNSGALIPILQDVIFPLPIWSTTIRAAQAPQRVRILETHLFKAFNRKEAWYEFDRNGW